MWWWQPDTSHVTDTWEQEWSVTCDASPCHVTRVTLCVTWEPSLTRGSQGRHLTPDTGHNFITSNNPGEISITSAYSTQHNITSDNIPVSHLTGCRPPEMIPVWSHCGHLSLLSPAPVLTTGDQTPDARLWSGSARANDQWISIYRRQVRERRGEETPQTVARMFNGKLEITFPDVVTSPLSLNLIHSGSGIKVTF